MMKIEKFNQLELSEQEMHTISGGNWWSDFKLGFADGFNWASGVITDIVSLLSELKVLSK